MFRLISEIDLKVSTGGEGHQACSAFRRKPDALQRWAAPQNKDWFAYEHSGPSARQVVAASLREWRNRDFEPEDSKLTIGGFGALAIAIFTLIEPGDEVIDSLPPWFFYEPMVRAMGGEPVKVKVRESDFDLDLEAIEAAV